MAICTLCKVDHGLKGCNKIKGCGKCRERTTHKASTCSKPYPKYSEQICDLCLEKGHEAGDCTAEMGKACKTCGHGDHTQAQLKAKGCPLLSGKALKDVGGDVLDQFTPKARAGALGDIEKEQAGSSSTPSKGLVHRPIGASGSPSKISEKGKASENPGSLEADQKTLSPAEEKAVQLLRWKAAEKKLPKKPDFALGGNRKEAKSNFIEIKIDKSVKIFKYSVTIEDEKVKKDDETEESKDDAKDEWKRKVKRETKRFLIDHYLTTFNRPSHENWASDYDSIIVSVGPLYKDSAKIGLMMPQPDDNADPQQQQNRVRSKLCTTVNEVGRVNMEALNKHVAGTTQMDTPDDLLKILNIISWKNINKPGSRIGKVGNKVYPEEQPENYGRPTINHSHPYFLRNGFFTSMRPGDGSVLLNVNTTTTAFMAPINLARWMEMVWPDGRPSEKEFTIRLKSVRVTLDLHKSSRTWVICNYWKKTVSETKFDQDGVHVSVADYLKKKYPNGSYKPYNPSTADLRSPCINLGSVGRQVWYPASVLTIMDWQIARESIQEVGGLKMANEASKKPYQNLREILGEGLKVLGLNPLEPFYKTFGLRVANSPPNSIKLVKVTTKKLVEPKILYQMGEMKGNSQPSMYRGGWNIENQGSWIEPRGSNRLFILPLNSEASEEDRNVKIPDAAKALAAALESYNMTNRQKVVIRWAAYTQPVAAPKKTDQKTSYRRDWVKLLNEMFAQLNVRKDEVPLLVIIIPKRDIPMYQEIKRWADCEMGIPSICITQAKFLKMSDDKSAAIRSNICLKINFKMRGVSHTIFPNVKDKGPSGAPLRTMIVGADVTHPGKSSGCPSMAAVVATRDDRSGHYLGSARLQTGREEYISDLEGMMTERILAWHTNSLNDRELKKAPWKAQLPDRILFYRDGVSESQYGMVLHEEKDQIMRGCQAAIHLLRKEGRIATAAKDWVPKLTLLVVTKRHHARFYPSVEPMTDNPDDDLNLDYGTVVDNVVITPYNFSFYLQSHYSHLGTARSALYVVIWDDCRYTPDDLHKITNNICWTSARAAKIVSVCTPARYADLLCDRLRCYMKPALEGIYTPSPLDKNKDRDTDPRSRKSPKSPGTPKSLNPRSPFAKSPNVGSPSSSSTAACDNSGSGSGSGWSGSRTASSPSDDGGVRSVEDYAEDPHVWMGRRLDGRKNPWHPNLDDCMFYL